MAKSNIVKKPLKVPPITNPELKKAIAGLREGNSPEKQNALSAALKKAKLLSPCAIDADLKPNAQGKITNIRPEQVRIYLINTNDGKTFFPAFTDLTEAGKFKVTGENDPVPQNVVRTIADFDRLLNAPDCKAEGVIINPGTDNIVIPAQLAAILAGRVKTTVQKQKVPANAPVKMLFTEPAVYPTRMINAVYDHCVEQKDIERVWLKQKTAAGQVSFFLAVEADQKDQTILEGIHEAAVPFAKDVPVEVVFTDKNIMDNIIKESVALYDRQLEL